MLWNSWRTQRAVEKRVFPVILSDQAFKVLVFNDHVGQPAGTLPDQMEEASDMGTPCHLCYIENRDSIGHGLWA